MTDLVASIIRTAVPAVIGALATFLVSLGVDLDPEIVVQLTLVGTTIATAAYYSAARWLEQKYAWARWLLGLPVQPHYAARDGARDELPAK